MFEELLKRTEIMCPVNRFAKKKLSKIFNEIIESEKISEEDDWKYTEIDLNKYYNDLKTHEIIILNNVLTLYYFDIYEYIFMNKNIIKIINKNDIPDISGISTTFIPKKEYLHNGSPYTQTLYEEKAREITKELKIAECHNYNKVIISMELPKDKTLLFDPKIGYATYIDFYDLYTVTYALKNTLEELDYKVDIEMSKLLDILPINEFKLIIYL